MMAMQTVNFGTLDSALLTGRENGKRARDKFHIKLSKDGYQLISSDDQLITSSYFLGLLGEELKSFRYANDALDRIDMKKLSIKSREELTLAIKRGLLTNSSGER